MKLYSKENCPNCEIIKSFIKENNFNVEIDNSCNRELAMINGIMQFPYFAFINNINGAEEYIAGVENIKNVLLELNKKQENPKMPEFFWGK